MREIDDRIEDGPTQTQSSLRLRSYRVYWVIGSTGDLRHAAKGDVCRADRGKLSRTDRVRAIVTSAKLAVDAA